MENKDSFYRYKNKDWREITHKRWRDTLEELECISRWTPSVKYKSTNDDIDFRSINNLQNIMLEISTRLLQNAKRICEEVDAKYKELGGFDESRLSPLLLIENALEETDIMRNPHIVIEEEIKEMVMEVERGGV